MIAALQSQFSLWWWRLFSRPTPATAVAAAPEPPMPPAELDPAATALLTNSLSRAPFSRLAVDQDELTRTLLQTVQIQAQHAIAPEPKIVDPFRRSKSLAALANLQQIPSLQSLARGFTEATSREDASVAEVVEAVQKDPALCVRVLRLANSAFFSPAQRIEDIMSAVQMLGVVRVRKIAQALFTMRDAHAAANGFDWRHLWVHGLATAAVAEELEKQLGLPNNPRLHLSALLHDVGKIVLSTVAPDTYRGVLIDAWYNGQRLEELEEVRLGVHHGEAGVIFAQHCSLGAETIEVIAHHAQPEKAESFPLTVALVHVANYVCKSYGLGFSGARLEETDGDLESLSAWKIIIQHCGHQPDLETLADGLRDFIANLKPELKSLRDGS